MILVLGTLLALFGLLAIYDASVVEGFKDFSDKFHFVKQQAVWLGLGVIVSLVAANFPLGVIRKYAPTFLLSSFILPVGWRRSDISNTSWHSWESPSDW